MKVNKFFLSLFSVCLSLLVIICLQGCEKDATTQSNNINSSTDSVVSSISLQDRYLDLDGDKKNDFWFTHSAVTTNSYPPSAIYFSLYVVCFDSNQVQNTLSAGSIPLQDSVQISDTSGWNNYSMSLAGATSLSHWNGPWIRNNKRNLGLRLRHLGSYYYGWVKLSVDSTNGRLSIIDSAYSANANTPILAGVHP